MKNNINTVAAASRSRGTRVTTSAMAERHHTMRLMCMTAALAAAFVSIHGSAHAQAFSSPDAPPPMAGESQGVPGGRRGGSPPPPAASRPAPPPRPAAPVMSQPRPSAPQPAFSRPDPPPRGPDANYRSPGGAFSRPDAPPRGPEYVRPEPSRPSQPSYTPPSRPNPPSYGGGGRQEPRQEYRQDNRRDDRREYRRDDRRDYRRDDWRDDRRNWPAYRNDSRGGYWEGAGADYYHRPPPPPVYYAPPVYSGGVVVNSSPPNYGRSGLYYVYVGGRPFQVPDTRIRYYREVPILRPYGGWYPGYGRYVTDEEAYRWIGFSAITTPLLSQLDDDQQRALEDAQIAASEAQVGQRIAWSLRGARGTVQTTRAYDAVDGRYCRVFEQVVTVDGNTERAEGVACRDDQGIWQVLAPQQ